MATPSNVAEYTVSELSFALKRTVEETYGYVRLRGEVSGWRGPHSSGHAYFALKDEKARIEAVIWRTAFSRLKMRPEEGLEVIATGRLTTYPGSSKYQIVIEALEPAGIGALMALVEERKQRLTAEGLFDAERKRPLPYLPRVIGVVTSPTGAVIRDILHRITDRFPVHVVVWPVRVQGETCGAEVTAAITGFNAIPVGGPVPRPDLIIVARGGGSLEDLWGFNDEAAARAAAASLIPLISAVGHETDWTLMDLAADQRAPTPTGAAEIAVPVRSDLLASIETCARRHAGAVQRLFEARRTALRAASAALPRPRDILALPRQRLDAAEERLPGALRANTLAHHRAFERSAARLRPGDLAARIMRSRDETAALLARAERCLGAGVGRRRDVFERCAVRLRSEALSSRIVRARGDADALMIRAGRCLDSGMRHRRAMLSHVAVRLRGDMLAAAMLEARARLGGVDHRLARCFSRMVGAKRSEWDATIRVFAAVNYHAVLERGFALVRDADGAPVRTAASVHSGARLELEFADGRLPVVADPSDAVAAPVQPRTPTPRSRTSEKKNEPQGSLF